MKEKRMKFAEDNKNNWLKRFGWLVEWISDTAWIENNQST